MGVLLSDCTSVVFTTNLWHALFATPVRLTTVLIRLMKIHAYSIILAIHLKRSLISINGIDTDMKNSRFFHLFRMICSISLMPNRLVNRVGVRVSRVVPHSLLVTDPRSVASLEPSSEASPSLLFFQRPCAIPSISTLFPTFHW